MTQWKETIQNTGARMIDSQGEQERRAYGNGKSSRRRIHNVLKTKRFSLFVNM
jgi:hypothetical protein